MRDSINPTHLSTQGCLTYFRASEYLVSVGTGAESLKVLLISFGADGSLYVQFPYFMTSEGALRHLEFNGERPFPRSVHLAENGAATKHLVKYTHHVDGEAHFSQSGKVFTKVRRKSFRLDGPIGHVFQLAAFHPEQGFQRLNQSMLKVRRPSLEFTFPTMPKGVTIVGDWQRIASLEAWARGQSLVAGPVLSVGDRKSRKTTDWMLLGARLRHGQPSHVLVLKAMASGVPEGVDDPTVVFIGGWDMHEVASPTERVEHSGALLCSYPAAAERLIEEGAVSIDLPGHKSA